jgi:hypothetical protein
MKLFSAYIELRMVNPEAFCGTERDWLLRRAILAAKHCASTLRADFALVLCGHAIWEVASAQSTRWRRFLRGRTFSGVVAANEVLGQLKNKFFQGKRFGLGCFFVQYIGICH